jgi:hypothetical protein
MMKMAQGRNGGSQMIVPEGYKLTVTDKNGEVVHVTGLGGFNFGSEFSRSTLLDRVEEAVRTDAEYEEKRKATIHRSTILNAFFAGEPA